MGEKLMENEEMSSVQRRNTEKEIYFNFSYSALKLLGKNLYSSPINAISELVANSLDASASNVYVFIDMSDKEHSVVEVLDDGTGMDYIDLAEKYVWVGRNKRNDESYSSEKKKTVMGRKGIGKLAALYLSNQYYILSKKKAKEVIQWEIDLPAYDDSDFPKLDKVEDRVELVNEDIWNQFKTGTTIRLTNVDLRRNGSVRMESLRRILADFFLLDAIGASIYVAVKTNAVDNVEFQKVEKSIAFRNFYAVFDNSGRSIAEKMQKSIEFTWLTRHEQIGKKPRETHVIDTTLFPTSGEKTFHKEDGTEIRKKYELVGWIAIHSTIEQKNAVDERFLRNSVYQPNRLRLYVRNKIAIDDYFNISPSTQAMSNYIEGEISFNILDDNDLPDIATSSRQSFLADERIELLISIVNPIVNTLFGLRNRVGRIISDESKEYEELCIKQEKELREAEERAREKAEKDRIAAEDKYKTAQSEMKKYHAQSNIIFQTVTEDQENFSAKTHLIKTNALTIRNSVATLAKKIDIGQFRELKSIAITTDKILSLLKYTAIAKFNIEDENIDADLFVFCKEYLQNILAKQYFDTEIKVEVLGTYVRKFNPQYITLLLDNLVANSEKSSASSVQLVMENAEEGASLVYTDNGHGFNGVDVEQIFEFGFSNTGGTGIGLYNVKSVVTKMHGKITAEDNEPTGVRFIIILP